MRWRKWSPSLADRGPGTISGRSCFEVLKKPSSYYKGSNSSNGTILSRHNVIVVYPISYVILYLQRSLKISEIWDGSSSRLDWGFLSSFISFDDGFFTDTESRTWRLCGELVLFSDRIAATAAEDHGIALRWALRTPESWAAGNSTPSTKIKRRSEISNRTQFHLDFR